MNLKIMIRDIKQFKEIISLEEHQLNGGLGSILTNLIYDNNLKVKSDDLIIKERGNNEGMPHNHSVVLVQYISVVRVLKCRELIVHAPVPHT